MIWTLLWVLCDFCVCCSSSASHVSTRCICCLWNRRIPHSDFICQLSFTVGSSVCCPLFEIGYYSRNSGTTCQIMYFLCHALSDASHPNKKAFTQEGCPGSSRRWIYSSLCPLHSESQAASKAALGSSRACAQGAVGLAVSPTVTSNTFFHLSYMA